MDKASKVDVLSSQQRKFRLLMAVAACLFAAVFLALSIWIVRGTEEDHLLRAARNYAKAIDSFRSFYAEHIVSPLVGHPWVIITEHYKEEGGAIPIPFTMTMDLVEYMSQRDMTINARLISDFPFPQRADRIITEFDKEALQQLRSDKIPEYFRFTSGEQGKELLYATPILMQPTCVTCHNNHRDSPKNDWQVGDVRGMQVVSLPSSQNAFALSERFAYLIVFVVLSFLSALLALFLMDGRVRKTVKLLHDRNDKLEATTIELKQQQNALDQHAIVSMTDRAGDIIYTNQHFKDISGYSEDELLGKNHRLINSGYHPKEMFETMWKTITAGKVWHGEIKNINKLGEHYWVKATIMPLYDSKGQIDRYISIRTDITQQKQLEQNLKKSYEDLYALTMTLDEARKSAVSASEAKSAFLANMSHEIRTPMTGIIGMTELALDTPLTATQRGYLGVVKSSADALLSILNDILDFSKIDAGKLEISVIEIDIKDLLMQCLKPAAVLARKKGVSLVVDISPQLPDRCLLDPVRVRQVLVNICDNAIKFTPQGEVLVTVDWQTLDDQTGELILGVRDQGIGISAEQQQHIFQPFSQADESTTRSFGGTGLGLTITARLVELMGGEIGLESELGQGSFFWIKLPTKVTQVSPHPNISSQPNVILLSDRQAHLRSLQVQLGSLGLMSKACDSIDTFWKAVETKQDQTTYFIVEHYLSGALQGIEVIKKLIEQGHSLEQCILISDVSGDALSETVNQMGITHVVTHPPTRSELSEMLLPNSTIKAAKAEVDLSSTLNILLVEDNKVNQKLITTLLVKRGHQVLLAENGQEAVALCLDELFDLILMDMQMPVMGGVEATRLIRENERLLQRNPTPVFAMTANVLPTDKEACLNAGMNGHLGKPVKLAELDAVLDAVKRTAPK